MVLRKAFITITLACGLMLPIYAAAESIRGYTDRQGTIHIGNRTEQTGNVYRTEEHGIITISNKADQRQEFTNLGNAGPNGQNEVLPGAKPAPSASGTNPGSKEFLPPPPSQESRPYFRGVRAGAAPSRGK